MDISAKTASTDANSSLTVKSSDQNDSDNINSDRESPFGLFQIGQCRKGESDFYLRRNFSNKNNNNHFHCDKLDNSPNQINISENFSDTNDNMHSSPESTSTINRNDSRHICPICGVKSKTQHDFTEHIRGHNSMDDTQNFTCQICYKVSPLLCTSEFLRQLHSSFYL